MANTVTIKIDGNDDGGVFLRWALAYARNVYHRATFALNGNTATITFEDADVAIDFFSAWQKEKETINGKTDSATTFESPYHDDAQ